MTLKTQGLRTLEQLRTLLDGAQVLGFEARPRERLGLDRRRATPLSLPPGWARSTRAWCGAIWRRRARAARNLWPTLRSNPPMLE